MYAEWTSPQLKAARFKCLESKFIVASLLLLFFFFHKVFQVASIDWNFYLVSRIKISPYSECFFFFYFKFLHSSFNWCGVKILHPYSEWIWFLLSFFFSILVFQWMRLELNKNFASLLWLLCFDIRFYRLENLPSNIKNLNTLQPLIIIISIYCFSFYLLFIWIHNWCD